MLLARPRRLVPSYLLLLLLLRRRRSRPDGGRADRSGRCAETGRAQSNAPLFAALLALTATVLCDAESELELFSAHWELEPLE